MWKINDRINHFQSSIGGASCQSPLSYPVEVIIIVACCLIGLIWAVINIFSVESINVRSGYDGTSGKGISEQQRSLLLELGDKISLGAKEFLKQ